MIFFSYPLCSFIVLGFLLVLSGGWLFVYFPKLLLFFIVGWMVFIRFHLKNPLGSLHLPLVASVKAQVLLFVGWSVLEVVVFVLGSEGIDFSRLFANFFLAALSIAINYISYLISDGLRKR